MQTPPTPCNEAARLNALWSYGLLDTPTESIFDEVTALAAGIAQAPISLISLVDKNRQWFKSRHGLPNVRETPRDVALCSHAILRKDPLIVADALNDARFADNPLVSGDPKIRFYAGFPLFTGAGHGLGTLCVIDRVPRTLSDQQIADLRRLAHLVLALFEARADRDRFKAGHEALDHSELRLRKLIDALPASIAYIDPAQHYVFVNQAYESWFGKPRDSIIGLTVAALMGAEAYAQAKAPLERALKGEAITFEICVAGTHRRHVQAHFVPDMGAEGVRGVFALFSDITSRVEEELRRQYESPRAMSTTLYEEIEAERKRIANALHDQMGQDLAVAVLHAGRIQMHWRDDKALNDIVQNMLKILQGTGSAMRRIVADLRPLALEYLGIAVAAKLLVEEIENASGVNIDVTVQGEFTSLPDALQTSLYRILQECLTNIVKHAQASEARVMLIEQAGRIELRVEDDGRGFSVQAPTHHERYGLLGMQERASALGGTFMIDSTPGQGARVTIVIPLAPALADHSPVPRPG
jgi:PAS domain S-box-containing protein